MFFLIKGIRLSVWGTKDINLWEQITSVNFANIRSQFKFIDAMKYFSTSLGKLASTLDDDEKTRVEKLTLQFLNQHCYFSWTWKVLDIIVS